MCFQPAGKKLFQERSENLLLEDPYLRHSHILGPEWVISPSVTGSNGVFDPGLLTSEGEKPPLISSPEGAHRNPVSEGATMLVFDTPSPEAGHSTSHSAAGGTAPLDGPHATS
jgi:hypothetical protein